MSGEIGSWRTRRERFFRASLEWRPTGVFWGSRRIPREEIKCPKMRGALGLSELTEDEVLVVKLPVVRELVSVEAG